MLQLPEIFVKRMSTQLGNDSPSFFRSLEEPTPVSIRMNPFKPLSAFERKELVPWCENGRYLQERISFTLDPLFHAGCYYVQEASSMFIEMAFREHSKKDESMRVLDLCAAPGGKSTHLLSLLSRGSLLVSNEPIPSRNAILRDNLSKWGCENVMVTQNDPQDFNKLRDYFDIVLVDAPCSGEGLFRKNHDAVREWNESNLAMCSTRQHAILENVLPSLKPGGMLIYSTCTYNESENDGACEFLQKTGDLQPMELEPLHGAVKTRFGLQMFPHLVRGEGFFMAALKKTDDPVAIASSKKWNGKPVSFKSASEWLLHPENFLFESQSSLLFAIPKEFQDEIQFLRSKLFVRKAGICMGSLSGDELIPSQELAMFVGHAEQLPSVELPLEEALRYLRGEALANNTQLKGWCIASFNGHALGWMKGVGNRFNNSYPKELRIKNL